MVMLIETVGKSNQAYCLDSLEIRGITVEGGWSSLMAKKTERKRYIEIFTLATGET